MVEAARLGLVFEFLEAFGQAVETKRGSSVGWASMGIACQL
jgi:hypothetical protein